MLDADYLDAHEGAPSIVRNSYKPMGGIKVVMLGDFLQLPPAGNGRTRAKMAFQSSAWAAMNIQCVELKVCHRQTDTEFVKHLGSLRSGQVPSDTPAYVCKIEATKPIVPAGIEPICLTTTKHSAFIHNTLKCKRYREHSDFTVSKSRDSSSSGDILESFYMAVEMSLSIGCQVLCLISMKNHGVHNGSIGKVIGLQPSPNPNFPTPVVLFPCPGKVGLVVPMHPHDWITEGPIYLRPCHQY